MRSTVDNPTANKELLVAEVTDQFIEEAKQGRAPSIEDYAQAHPEIAGIIRQVFPALALLDTSQPTTEQEQHEHSPVTGQLGDFRIWRELGRGGMGVVYEAEQISIGRRVALKVLPFAAMLDKQQLNRFKNEARAAGTLDHPNIVAVHSVGTERGVHYYAMQLIEGQSLAEVIAARRAKARGERSVVSNADDAPTIDQATSHEPHAAEDVGGPAAAVDTRDGAQLSTAPAIDTQEYCRKVATLGIQAAKALDHAHQNGIVHRDVKPGNLLVDTEGKLYVTDFGLARIEADAGMTMTGDLLGTLRYMSPEQALAKRAVVDHRTDVYSLAVTLYELLTLQPAYHGADRQELLKQIAFEEPKRLRQVNPRLPIDLETIVAKAMEKDPDDRYATAQELADDLRCFVSDQPIKARQPSLVQRITKWSRRHVGVVWAALATAILISTILAGSTALVSRSMRQAERQRELAEAETARSQQIVQFMKDMLAGVGPGVARGDDTTLLRRILDQTASRIDDELGDQPELEAELRETLGTVYDELGEQDRAEIMLLRALEIRRDTAGPDSLHVARVLHHLGNVYAHVSAFWEKHRNEKSERCYRDSLEIRRTILGDKHPEVADSLAALATVLREERYDLSRIEEATALTREALAQRRIFFGDVSLPVAESLHHLAHTFDKSNPEKIDVYVEALTIREKLLGRNHPDTAASLVELGNAIYRIGGNKGEAEAMMREGLGIQQEVLGDHAATVMSLSKLAARLRREKRAESEILRRQALMMASRVFGDEHPSAADISSRFTFDDLIAGNDEDELRAYLRGTQPKTASEFCRRAEVHKALGEYRNAIDAYTGAIQLDPDNPGHWTWRGRVYLELENSENAIADHTHALDRAPWSADAWQERGKVLRHFGQHTRAINDYSEAIRLNNGVAHYWWRRGQCYQSTGQLQNALKDFSEAVRLNPRHADALGHRASTHFSLGNYEQAMADFERAVELDSLVQTGNLPSEAFTEAPQIFREKLLSIVDRELQSGDFNDVDDGGLWKRRCVLHFYLGNYDSALADIKRAVELGDWAAPGWLPATAVRDAPESFREGLLNIAKEVVPQSAEDYHNRGHAFMQIGNAEQALHDFSIAIEMDPDDSHHWDSRAPCRANAYAQLGRWEEALEDYSKGVELFPGNPFAHYWCALAHLGAGDTEAYRSRCQAMLEQFAEAEEPEAAHWVAWTCSLAPDALTDYAPAVTMAERAFETDRDSTFYVTTLGGILFRAGRLDDAIETLIAADKLAKDQDAEARSSSAYTWYFLAMAQHRQGKAEEADTWLAKANGQEEAELNNQDTQPAWNRKLTLRLLRKEAGVLLNAATPEPENEDAIEATHEPEDKWQPANG